MGSYALDTSRWPIAICRVEGVLDDAQIDQFVSAGNDMLMRREPYAVVWDLSAMGIPTAYARGRSLQWQKEQYDALGQYCLGTVYVMPSPIVRFISMTIFMLARPPSPFRVCEGMDEAIAWAEQQLAGRR
jgi:hypothetical protein